MYNWSTDLKTLKKYPQQYTIWKLQQLINFGLGNEKIDRKILSKHLHKLEIDHDKRKYLEFLLKE